VSHLAAADLARLSKMLEVALRTTTPEGERAAATARASALLDRHGLRWGDVARQMQAEPVHREPLRGTWRTVCARLLERQDELSQWERGFVRDLPRFRRLSTKQRYCLNEIARRVLGESATDYRE
jgi:Protein of unknown function (DUF2786)